MARKKKPQAFPDYLFDLEQSWPGEAEQFCLWLCSGCGAPYHYRIKDGKHGRPSSPFAISTNKPHYVAFIGPCWRSHEYGVKCVTPKGARILYHEGFLAPGPELIAEITRGAARQRRIQEKELTALRKAATVVAAPGTPSTTTKQRRKT